VDVANKGLSVMVAHKSAKTMQIFINSSIFPTEGHPFDHVIWFFKKWRKIVTKSILLWIALR